MHVPIEFIVKQEDFYISPYAFPGLVKGSVRTPSIIVQPEVICADITKKVAKYFGINDIEKLKVKTRKRTIVKPRQISIFILRAKGVTCTDIGTFFNQDHSTIVHSERVVKGMIEVDVDYRKLCKKVASFVNSED